MIESPPGTPVHVVHCAAPVQWPTSALCGAEENMIGKVMFERLIARVPPRPGELVRCQDCLEWLHA